MANANETLKVLDRVLNQSNLIFYRHSQFSFWVSEIWDNKENRTHNNTYFYGLA